VGLTTGSEVALAAPAAGAAVQVAEDPIDCPSAGCRKASDQLFHGYGVAVEDAGHAYVADGKSGRLMEVDLATGKASEVATGIGYALGVALDGQGSAYVTDNNGGLWKVDLATGQKSEAASGLGDARDVALDGNGLAYVTDYAGGKLFEVDLSTHKSSEIASGFGKAHSLALDGKGTAYVTQTETGTLYAVKLETGQKRVVAEGLTGVQGVTLTDRGTAYTVGRDGLLREVNLTDGTNRTVARKSDKFNNVALARDGSVYMTEYGTTLWRVKGGPPAQKVRVEGVPGVWTSPGRNAWPKVKVTNTSGAYLGTQDVTLTLDSTRLGWSYNVVYTDRDGQVHEYPCTVQPGDGRTSLCKNVDLRLEPGQSAEFRTEVGVSKDAEICEKPAVTWKLAGASGKSGFVVKNPDGSPEQC
ncbi:Vgb family protein, partial [Streptomyces flavofungini]|uniref:Vgb family protein n=1 Tax=Streptomyces flavofungini TaxID=68200 RepID=UPI003F7E78FE